MLLYEGIKYSLITEIFMNGFCYDSKQKIIKIEDSTSVVIWKFVEPEIANEAGEMYNESKSIDAFLLKNGCERSWGNKSQPSKKQ